MRSRKALVTNVAIPRVAHAGLFAVTVVYGSPTPSGFTRKVRKTVFTAAKPEIGSWIEIGTLKAGGARTESWQHNHFQYS